jgi:hypothetical protein
MTIINQEGLHGRNNPVESSSPPGTLMDRVAYAQRLWTAAFAGHNLSAPEDAFFIRALSKFSVEEFEYAVGRVARKFPVKRPARPPFVTLDNLCSYTIGVLNGQRADREGAGA